MRDCVYPKERLAFFTSQHSRQITICRATRSEPETDWKPVLGTSSRILSCFLAASVVFGSPEYLLDGDPAFALDFPSSTEQRQALNQRRKEILREAKERALQQVSGGGEAGKSEDSPQEKVEETQKSRLDLLTESVQEQQKRYEEQISKSKILVPKSGTGKSFTPPELPKFSFPSFGGTNKKTEETSKKIETSKATTSPEVKSEIKEKQKSVESTKIESPDTGSPFSDLLKKYSAPEEKPKPVTPKVASPFMSKPKEETVKPKDETTPSLPDFMKKFSAPEQMPESKPVIPKPLIPKLKEEPAKPEIDAPSPFTDLLKKYSAPEEKPKPVTPKVASPFMSKPKEETVKPKDETAPSLPDFMKKYAAPEEKPTPSLPTPILPKQKQEPVRPDAETPSPFSELRKKYSTPEEKPKPAIPPVVIPKPKQEPANPNVTGLPRFSDLIKKYSAPEEKPAPVVPKTPPPVVSKPKEEPAKPQDEATPTLPDFMRKYSAPEETPKPVLPPVVIPEPKQKPVEPKTTPPSRFSDLMKKYSAPEEQPKPILPPPPPVVSKPKEEPAKSKEEEGMSFSDFMKKYGAPEEAPKPVIPPPIIPVPRDDSTDSGSIKDILKKKYESTETTKPTISTKKQIPRKVEQKKALKAKRRGVLPLWATQFLMLGLFGGFIFCFTALYDATSNIIKTTFTTIDQFLEDLRFSYNANQSSENNKS